MSSTSEKAPWWVRCVGGVVLLGLALAGWVGGDWGREHRVTVQKRPVLRGVALGLFASDPSYDYHLLLKEIAALGATDLLVSLAWYQRDIFSTKIAPLDGRSPTLATYRRTLQQARDLGFRVAVMPLVRLQQRRATEWRGVLRPAGGPIAWFRSYQRYLQKIAKIAQEEGVSRLAVGSEFGSLEPYTEAWRGLIRTVRRDFSGKLFYSANWDSLEQIHFVDHLDEIAVTGYLPMAQKDQTFSHEDALLRWDGFFRKLREAQQRWKKPLFLSEVGYPSIATAAHAPWDETVLATPNPSLQAALWQVFCEAYKREKRTLKGFYAWNWFGFGGASDTTFTPRGKPAAKVLSACLR
ncbi:MAG: hypothetical protein H6727_12980 [Myxococcales bacterium]|nr:hypothetical protein [Myxococcales bacterium]